MTATQTLKDHNLRHTSNREELLNLLLQTDHALAHGDIEACLGPDYDRVTIYRTLRTFVDKGIIHKVLDDTGDPKYALCRHSCAKDDHHHDHVHFKCQQCGQTTCLDHVQIPAISLPNGYSRVETNLLIQGRCPECV